MPIGGGGIVGGGREDGGLGVSEGGSLLGPPEITNLLLVSSVPWLRSFVVARRNFPLSPLSPKLDLQNEFNKSGRQGQEIPFFDAFASEFLRFPESPESSSPFTSEVERFSLRSGPTR